MLTEQACKFTKISDIAKERRIATKRLKTKEIRYIYFSAILKVETLYCKLFRNSITSIYYIRAARVTRKEKATLNIIDKKI